jgi:hypothetical protein
MTLGHLIVLHLMAGVGVAGAVFLSTRGRPTRQRWFQVLTALVFWPLYLPVLLSHQSDERGPPEPGGPPAPGDDLARAIAQVDAELAAALRSLDGWAEGVLAREKDRLHDLRTAWNSQAQRIREMDSLLNRPEYADGPATLLAGPLQDGLSERLRASQQVIHQNIDRLRQVRERTLADLLATLAWVRELVSMIHLAKFTGAPPSRAEELVSQIAAAVEGLSALTWQEETGCRPTLALDRQPEGRQGTKEC